MPKHDKKPSEKPNIFEFGHISFSVHYIVSQMESKALSFTQAEICANSGILPWTDMCINNHKKK